MEHEFSMKELYDVFLKTTYPIEIAGKQFEAGETLCVFDKVQISNFNEIKNRILQKKIQLYRTPAPPAAPVV